MEWRRFVTYLWNDPRTTVNRHAHTNRDICLSRAAMMSANQIRRTAQPLHNNTKNHTSSLRHNDTTKARHKTRD